MSTSPHFVDQNTPSDDIPTGTESDNTSNSSTQTVQDFLLSHANMTSPQNNPVINLGTPLQQLSQRVTAAFSKFCISELLKDEGYTTWYRPILEVIRALGYRDYLVHPIYEDSALKSDENEQLRFLISQWILSQCDSINADRVRDNVIIRNAISMKSETNYDPHYIWKYLEQYHASITETKLSHISKALYGCAQFRNDSLRIHIQKFSNLLIEFRRFEGEISDSQAARNLISSLKPGYEITVKLIYRTIKPLTYDAVVRELLESEDEETFESRAMAQVSHTHLEAYGTQSSQPLTPRCTQDKCLGYSYRFPHKPEDCFKLPKNFNRRDEWLRQLEDKRRPKNRKKPTSAAVTTSSISGMKIVKRTSSSNEQASMIVLHSSFSDLDIPVSSITIHPDKSSVSKLFQGNELRRVNTSTYRLHPKNPDESVVAIAVLGDMSVSNSTSHELWALNDTGASHHMFNNNTFFEPSSLRSLADSNRRLKLAGGDVSLSVEAIGSVRLRSGNGTEFSLSDCLYVPELCRNLIAGGALI